MDFTFVSTSSSTKIRMTEFYFYNMETRKVCVVPGSTTRKYMSEFFEKLGWDFDNESFRMIADEYLWDGMFAEYEKVEFIPETTS